MIISKEESINYIGGGTISAALVSAVVSLAKTLYTFGQNLGVSIYKTLKKSGC